MTTLVTAALGGSFAQRQVESSREGGAGTLLARLHEESNRQVPFSHAKLLFREAAAAIERLEADLARVSAELTTERTRRTP